MNTIKLMATAGFAHVDVSENVERFLAERHHATINGTNWSYRLIDPTAPALLEGVVTYQFGAPQKFKIEYHPEKGWLKDGKKCNGHVG